MTTLDQLQTACEEKGLTFTTEMNPHKAAGLSVIDYMNREGNGVLERASEMGRLQFERAQNLFLIHVAKPSGERAFTMAHYNESMCPDWALSLVKQGYRL